MTAGSHFYLYTRLWRDLSAARVDTDDGELDQTQDEPERVGRRDEVPAGGEDGCTDNNVPNTF